jgi:hypothetical protein
MQDGDGIAGDCAGVNLKFRKIRLYKNNLYALVDSEDYERLNKYRWYARLNPHTKTFYAYRSPQSIAMHREVMKLIRGDGKQVDHKNPNRTLDNRKSNLRVCVQVNNSWNMRKPKSNSSGFKGVYFHKSGQKWMAYITVHGKRIHLGLHVRLLDAHAAYRTASQKYFGVFARP